MSNEYKAVIEEFLHLNAIVPVAGFLREDLNEENDGGLEYIAYVITNYPNLPGLLESVKLLASLESNGNGNEAQYDNKLTELLGVQFVSEVIGEKIVRLEGRSPFGTGNKTCDIESDSNGTAIFYEVKQLSSELLTQVPDDEFPGIAVFEPALPWKIKTWLKTYVINCIEKGADYMVCKVPAWHVKGPEKLTEHWVKGIYQEYQRTGDHSFRVAHGIAIPPFFRGVFVIRRDEHLFMDFQ